MVLRSPLCGSQVNQTASSETVPWLPVSCVCSHPEWPRKGEWGGMAPERSWTLRAGIPSCGGDKHTSKDVKNPTCSKSFCFLPRLRRVVLVFCEVVCSLSGYEVKTIYIILLSVRNEVSPPRLFHRSLTILLSIWGTQPGARAVHQRLK